MANSRYGWTEIVAGSSGELTVQPCPEFFGSMHDAQESLQAHVDSHAGSSPESRALMREGSRSGRHLLVTCPPTRAWAAYRIQDEVTPEQAARRYLHENETKLRKRITKSRGSGLHETGCAVAVLGIAGLTVAAWARSRWGL